MKDFTRIRIILEDYLSLLYSDEIYIEYKRKAHSELQIYGNISKSLQEKLEKRAKYLTELKD